MLVASGRRWALMVDTEDSGEPVLQEMLNRMDQSVLDLIIVEGFRHEAFPKIELHRPQLGKLLIYPEDQSVIAIASDDPSAYDTALPLLDINDPEAIAEFIASILQKKGRPRAEGRGLGIGRQNLVFPDYRSRSFIFEITLP